MRRLSDNQASELLPGHEWMAEAAGCSVTHLEMMGGVLRVPAPQRRAAVYLRDPSFLVCMHVSHVRIEFESLEDGVP